MLLGQLSESEALVRFAHQDQAAVRGDTKTLEIDLERWVEKSLKAAFCISHIRHWPPARLDCALTSMHIGENGGPKIRSCTRK